MVRKSAGRSQAYSIPNDPARTLKEQMNMRCSCSPGNRDSVVESLNGLLIDQACKQAIELGRSGLGGWLSISHVAASSAESALPFA